MTRRFILDENVIILAQKGENERGERDLTCLRLLNETIQICHTLVLDSDLWGRYLRQLNALNPQDAQIVLSVASILASASRMDGKIDLRPNAVAFADEASIPSGSQDDMQIVRLAVETGAMLVTTDEDLRDDLNSSGVAETYDLEMLSPKDALHHL